ncbi:fimbrillin family protein [Elizabethkingia meningoseptica]|uniref:fimbrillin family protein n=1 Tax=Elizabethkingia meningoseptica TaxID=238 RepID=UPI00201230E0|nr:fimbrillin family protein [Elizabethkingia meningoseptica]MCL1674253.1 fimbrillin family protein [Elizabethkingia meningoseptica]MCL1687958.1 fimbrillin family protein [Elizabethkingia meningoseptica]
MGKKRLLGLGAALALTFLAQSCKNDDYRDQDAQLGGNGQVQFSSSIGGLTTRVTGNTWDSKDAIGVFMKQGNGLSNALASNKKYTTEGNGNFSGDGSEVINYPATGSVDFIAYYPYTANLSGTTLPVSVATQTNLAAIDVLYSNNATGLTKTSGTANLTFAHKLAKVELNVKAGNGVADVNGLSVAYKNVNTTASLDLATGTLSGAAAPKDVTAKTTAKAPAQFVEAILIPGDYSSTKVVFTLASGTFTWTLPASTTLDANKKYTYDITLQTTSTGNEVAVTGTGTITDWTNVPGGSVNVDKDGGTDPGPGPGPGTGTEQTLYSETFGSPDPKASPKDRIGAYTGYTATGITYSDMYTDTYADIRATTTMDGHVWFPSGKDTGIKITGINATGATNLKLSYDLATNQAGAAIAIVKVRVNGVEQTLPAGTISAQNTYVPVNLSGIANSNNLTIEFYALGADNKAGYRVDNVKVLGTK